MDSAEQVALTPQNDNGQHFTYYNAKRLNVFAPDGRPVDGTREMVLTPSPHFDHLPVNTTFSSVLMPSNIKEDGNKAFLSRIPRMPKQINNPTSFKDADHFYVACNFSFTFICFRPRRNECDPVVRTFRSPVRK